MARHSAVKKVAKKRSDDKKSKVNTRALCKKQKPNNGQHGLRNGSTRSNGIDNNEKLINLAKQLVKSHPELSHQKALQIEKQRQEAKMKRDEDGTVAVWNHMTIDYDLEEYINQSKQKDNRNVPDMDGFAVETMELEIFGEEKENRNDDSGKKRGALRIRDVNSNIQKE
ncbi:hypothetical protein CRE_17497 [Caenorhabditis remanei]|uniref:Uncharacterized protein n=1 Tax=Caenorhabditis remanei TaxID=31234 RepID=E3N7T2_CAERE|nr:hypothetical protein CRE_17497 [Caenorhabditis remanei]